MKYFIFILTALSVSLHSAGLKDIYAEYFRFGTILNASTVQDKSTTDIVLAEFNSITPENELKPDATIASNCSGATDENIPVSLDRARSILDFANKHNLGVRGHALVWHNQTPECFFKANMPSNSGGWSSKEQMNKRMESYIKNIFAAFEKDYPNLNLYAYDVVNEAFENWGAGLRTDSEATGGTSNWYRIYKNDDFIVKAFEYARKYAPAKTKLFYNDYNEYAPGKRESIRDLGIKLKAAGTIDGIGMQSHLDLDNTSYPGPSVADYRTAISMFAKTGLEVQVTELDITAKSTSMSAQADRYRDIFKEIIAQKDQVTAVVVWGVKDSQSWRSSGNPLLFNNSGKKQSYTSVAALIPESEWGDGDASNPGGSGGTGGTGENPSTDPDCEPTENYEPAFCGGMDYSKVMDNDTYPPFEGSCVFIKNFEVIQPNLEATVLVNGVSNTCGEEWEDCPYNEKPETVDGGYYVYVKSGAINTYEDNGWQGIEAGKKLCKGTDAISQSVVSPVQVKVLKAGLISIYTHKKTSVEVFDLKGNKLANYNTQGFNTIELPLSKGVYILRVNGKNWKIPIY